MTGKMLAQLAQVFWAEAEAIVDAYGWPARAPLTDEELREVHRLRALSARLAYRAREAGCVDQGLDALFGSNAELELTDEAA